MALPTVAIVLQLLEFNDKVGVDVTWGLITLLFEDELSALIIARFDLNLLALCFRLACLRIVLNHVPLVLDLLDRSIVELFQRAADRDNDILWRPRSWLIQSPETIRKDALLSISATDGAVL